MFTAKESKSYVLSYDNRNWVYCSIAAAITEAITKKLFHCDWYTPAGYDCTESDIKEIEDVVNYYTNIKGYTISSVTFTPNEKFKNTRVKLHINWE